MTTLILDSSGAFSTAAVARDGELVASSSLRAQPLAHLHDQARELLARLGLAPADLERLAVVAGPGSWTGLNIAMAAAKTLAQVLGVPLVPLSTLDAVAAGERWRRGPVAVVLDAKRGNAYRALYPVDAAGAPRLADGRRGTGPLEELAAELAGAAGEPLVVEYGRSLAAGLAEVLPGTTHIERDALEPRALVRLLADAPPALAGEEMLGLAPVYGQSIDPRGSAGTVSMRRARRGGETG